MSDQPKLEPKAATHASEAGHFYTRDGVQIEEVPLADGSGMTKPTLRHARIMQLGRGVTSIIGCSSKPALEDWKVEQGILCALTLPRVAGESDADFIARVKVDAKERAKQAAEEGTRIHAQIQGHYNGVPAVRQYEKHVEGVATVLALTCGVQEWRTEVPCVSSRGFGTKADLSSPEWLIDFKGKDGDEAKLLDSRLYDEHYMQLAATREALGRPTLKCGICFVSRTHPGVAVIVGADEKKLERGWAMFLGLLDYSFAKDSFKPSWAV